MPIRPKVQQLSPDGYSRFFLLVDILSQAYAGQSEPLKILDVGGGSEFFEQELKRRNINYELTVIDIIDKPKAIQATYVQGDATDMPFETNVYDIVVSTDVLEHIPQNGKQAFLDECLRVAKELCIIAAPFTTHGVNDAEVAVNEFNKQLFGSGQDWLEEHLKYGKPRPEMFHETLQRTDVAYDDFGSQNITTWLLNTHINLIDAKLGLDSVKHHRINQFYDDNLLTMNEFVEPTYRHFFVMYKDRAIRSKIDIKRYKPTDYDIEKTVKYTSMLFDLFVDRIQTLIQNGAAADQKSLGDQATISRLEAEKLALVKTIEAQAAELKHVQPFMKIINSKVVNVTRTQLRKVKR